MVNGKKVPTAGLSSCARAREIAKLLKGWIESGSFFLTQPVVLMPSTDSGVQLKPLRDRPIENHCPQSQTPEAGRGLVT